MTELLQTLHTASGEFVESCYSTSQAEDGCGLLYHSVTEWNVRQKSQWNMSQKLLTRSRNFAWPLSDMALFRDVGVMLTNQNCVHEKFKIKLNSGNVCCH
jgi:hypothetical protein